MTEISLHVLVSFNSSFFLKTIFFLKNNTILDVGDNMRVTDLIEHHYLRINAVLVDSRFTGVCVCVCVCVWWYVFVSTVKWMRTMETINLVQLFYIGWEPNFVCIVISSSMSMVFVSDKVCTTNRRGSDEYVCRTGTFTVQLYQDGWRLCYQY